MIRFEKHAVKGTEAIHWMWVVGPAGAVTTWFSESTKDIIGYSVCDGAAVHHPHPVEGLEPNPCQFLETTCWSERGSMMFLDPIIEAYDAGNLDIVWAWLETYYDDLTLWSNPDIPGPQGARRQSSSRPQFPTSPMPMRHLL